MDSNASAQATVQMSADYLAYTSLAVVAFMFVALLGVLYIVRKMQKITRKDSGEEKIAQGRFTRRSIQFLASALVLPTIALLALNGLVSREVIGTLLGTFIGYVLSGLGESKRGDSA